MNPEELQKQLDALKIALETAVTAKAKKETEDQIKALELKLAEAAKDAPDVAGLVKKVADLEAAAVIKDEADKKNQQALDNLIAKQNERKIDKSKKIHFGSRLHEGIMKQEDAFRNLKKGQRVTIDLLTPEETKAAADMDFATNFPTADVSVAFLKPGIIELPKRKLHIRELLQGGGMDNKSTFNFVKETTTTGVPLPAAEGELKEEIALNLAEASVPAEWIAAFIRISRNMLDDVTGMVTFLNSRLPELLLRAEDNQLLNGNGTSPNLSGITDAGNFTAATGTATIDWEQIIQAISQLEGLDREANGVLLHPSSYWKMPLYKGTSNSMYSAPAIVNISMDQGILRIAGVPVFRSTAATAGQFIVGDWTMGANLITREPARVEFFYEDGINVRENKVTVRIEERIAFPIYGDNYFIVGTLGNNS
jgi:HK97 family phage major capsid protein